MYSISQFDGDLFSEMYRLQRQMRQTFDLGSPSIRGDATGFPAVNVGTTPTGTEIYAFVPGVDPAKIDVTLERGILSLSGERAPIAGDGEGKAALHSHERFAGRFRRVISLPEDSDADSVQAECRDGVLHISIKRHAASQPRRIEVQ